jgi:nitrous oxidase accessory protein NosD
MISGLSINSSGVSSNAINIVSCVNPAIQNNTLTGNVRNGNSDGTSGIQINNSSGGIIAGNIIAYFMSGISVSGSTLEIQENTITGDNSYFNYTKGIEAQFGTYKIISNSISHVYQSGILAMQTDATLIKNNLVDTAAYGIYVGTGCIVKDNTVVNSTIGINCSGSGQAEASQSKISSNMIRRHGVGMYIFQGASPIINFNTITDSMNYYGLSDIYVSSDSRPVITSNTYNSIEQTTAVGRFNVDFNGNLVTP